MILSSIGRAYYKSYIFLGVFIDFRWWNLAENQLQPCSRAVWALRKTTDLLPQKPAPSKLLTVGWFRVKTFYAWFVRLGKIYTRVLSKLGLQGAGPFFWNKTFYARIFIPKFIRLRWTAQRWFLSEKIRSEAKLKFTRHCLFFGQSETPPKP
jgi:hypothetical protein